MRIFLGWERPAIAAVADLLLRDYRQGAWLDLSPVAVVVPGSRAGRRFLQVLLQAAQQARLKTLPPKIATLGALPELLYSTDRRLAPPWIEEWGWARSLGQLPAEAQSRMLGPSTPATDFSHWQMARRIQRSYQELAADGWRPADVVRRWPRNAAAASKGWWRTLVQWEDRYLRLLAAHGFADRHDARLSALRNGLCHCDLDIFLVGTADLRRQVRQMLQAVSPQITACIFAPPEFSEHFDELGGLLPEPWMQRAIAFADTQWSVARGPADLASVVADAVRQRTVRSSVTIGVTDDSLIPNLQRASQQHGATARWATGQPFSQTSPWRLLQLLRAWLARDDSAAKGLDLLRHPDVADWLVRQGAPRNWLERCDRTRERCVPSSLADVLADERLSECRRAVHRWQELFAGTRPLHQWTQLIGDWMAGLLTGVELQGHQPDEIQRWAAWNHMANRLQEWSDGPPALALRVTAVEALIWLLQQLERESIPSEADPDAWEMLGWLELLLDDAPQVVVAGFSEAAIPGTTASDRMWPVSLPAAFQVPHDQLRWARDAYVLTTILSARESCHIVVGRVDGTEAPVLPSRLLFQDAPATVAQRWQRVLHDVREEPSAAASNDETCPSSRFTIPRLDDYLEPMTTIRVTDFAAYLACPYRFYLRHILKLQPVAHEVNELSPAAFGNLAHEVLAEFGRGPWNDSDDVSAIESALLELLQAAVNEQYGSRLTAAVQLQVSQLQLRLRRFAVEQARCRRAGWRILHVEYPTEHTPIPWIVDGVPMGLVGRMDRIDRHEDDKRLRILDYKTSEQALAPRAKHGPDKQGHWKDLQLPLYVRLARGLSLEEPIELGYFPLGKTRAATRIRLADWSNAELAGAERAAEQVIRNIRAQKFWPPVYPPPRDFDTLSAICMDDVRERQQDVD